MNLELIQTITILLNSIAILFISFTIGTILKRK